MKKTTLLAALLAAGLVSGAWAQTSHYLFYQGGVIVGTANPEDDVFDGYAGSILVADVDTTAKTVSNWRLAGNVLRDNPDTPTVETYTFAYTENAVNAYNGYLYVGPASFNSTGTDAQIVTYAPIYSDGSLGTFAFSSAMPNDHTLGGGTAIVEIGGQAYFYVLGGGSTVQIPTIAYAAINSGDGSLGAWQTATAVLPVGDWFNRAAAKGSTIIHQSGNISRGSVGRFLDYGNIAVGGDLASLTSGADFGAGVKLWDNGFAIASAGGNDFVVIAGGSNGTTADTVYTAQITAGVPATPALTNPLPAVRRRCSMVAIGDMLIMPGGSSASSSGNGQSTVFVGTINSSGAVTWVTDATAMPQARSFGGATAHTISGLPASVHEWMAY